MKDKKLIKINKDNPLEIYIQHYYSETASSQILVTCLDDVNKFALITELVIAGYTLE